MTKKDFWQKVVEHLEEELPFEIEEVVGVEADISGGVFVDLRNGSTYTINIDETSVNWDD